MKKYAYTFVGVLAVGITAAIFMRHTPVCPDDFATEDAQLAAVNAWTNDFFDAHPDATMTDWGNARHQFWIDNNCTAALQRYEEAKAMGS